MKHLICLPLLVAGLFLPGCRSAQDKQPQTYYVLPYEAESVVLQNLKSRAVVYCYPSVDLSAEDCAKDFEQRGYVRLRDIPRFTAEDDILKADTYPTRRWRQGEKIPRW